MYGPGLTITAIKQEPIKDEDTSAESLYQNGINQYPFATPLLQTDILPIQNIELPGFPQLQTFPDQTKLISTNAILNSGYKDAKKNNKVKSNSVEKTNPLP